MFYNVLSTDPNYVEVTYKSVSGGSYRGDVIIPETVSSNSGMTYEVKGISDKAFYKCIELNSVVIPQTVTYIGENAFRFCEFLKFIKIEEGNPIYDSREDCNAIIESASNTLLYGSWKTVIPNTVTAIGNDAFNKIRIDSDRIVIPNSVITIGDRAFMESGWGATLVIPNSIQSIGSKAFTNSFPSTVISYMQTPIPINKDCWYDYDSFDVDAIDDWLHSKPTLYVPKGKVNIYKKTTGWSWFKVIKEMTNDPDTPIVGEEIAYSGIYYKIISLNPNEVEVTGALPEKLYINIPEKVDFKNESFEVKEICANAFSNTGILSVSLPKNITYIGDHAFESSCLSSVTIPQSVTHIGEQAFLLTNMFTIVVEEGNPAYDSRDNCNAIIETETNTLLYGCLNTTIPNTVTAIGDDAFNGVMFNPDYVLKIPNSVTSIGDRAFRNAELYCSLTIPSSVNHIGSEAFYHYTPSVIYSKIQQPFEIPLDCWLHPEEMEDSEFGLKGYLEKEVVLYVPKGTANAYKNTSGWNIFKQIIEMEGSSTPSGITDLQQEDAATKAIYNVNGQRLEQPRKGINIINKKKVLVK